MAPVVEFGVCPCTSVLHLLLGSPVSYHHVSKVLWLIDAARSDRIGRRPVLFIGLTGSMISAMLFGFSRSFVWALIARSLGETGHDVDVLSMLTLPRSRWSVWEQ
jgi:MFS family permease